MSSTTFADKLFDNLNSLKDVSYKLDETEDITLNGSITGTTPINATIYGLDYQLGDNSKFTVGEKVADLSLNIEETEQRAPTTNEKLNNINLNMTNKKITGFYNKVDMTVINETVEIDQTEETSLNIKIGYNGNGGSFRIYYSSLRSSYLISTRETNMQSFQTLPDKNNINPFFFTIEKYDSGSSTGLPTQTLTNITVKDMSGNIIWKFNIEKQTNGSFILTEPEDGGQLPYYLNNIIQRNITYLRNFFINREYKDFYIYLKNNRLTYKSPNTVANNGISNATWTPETGETIQITPLDDENDIYSILWTSDNVFNGGKLYAKFATTEITEAYFYGVEIKSSDANNFTLTHRNVSKPYPALFILSNGLGHVPSVSAYNSNLNQAINNIAPNVLEDGIISTIPKFVRN